MFLLDAKIAFEQYSQNVSMPNGETIEIPGYRLEMDNTPLLLLIFDHKGLRQAPRCPATGKPMQRFSLNKVEELIRLSSI